MWVGRWTIAVLLLFVIGCDETPTAPTRQDLTGSWRVTSIHFEDATPIAPPDGHVLTVEFADDRVSVQTGCNACSGRYALTGQEIGFSLLACTRRACPEGSLEGPFLLLLETARTAGIVTGTTLVIAGEKGELLLRR